MQSPSKISDASASTTTPAVCGLQGWADLPEGLLHSIFPLLNSFLELLAFAGTCHSWRAAFASYPSKSTLCSLLPPLLVRPHINVRAPNLPSRSDDGHELRTCQVLDPANLKSSLRCQIPEETFEDLCFAGSSYGQLICGGGTNCLIVDVFTGVKVLPPQLPFNDDTYFYSGLLTAPLSSNNSHLLVCAASNVYSIQSSLLDWPVGSDSWSELRLSDTRIEQIVEFNGQFIVLDGSYNLHTLSLAPQLGLQGIATVWWDGMDECPYLRPWLVVCGGMLLMVDHYMTLSFNGAPVNYKAYRLDMSTVPAVWVEVKKLENYSLFIGSDVRSPAFSCASPERWNGRSNCLYYGYYYQPWVLHGLGDDADAVWDPENDPDLVFKRNWYIRLQPFWVYPSMFYR
ncbi:uncharacterized protein LOC8067917 isoform X1 [Sorghum bicolor]|uniref:KIB1-4 beta-propeller domain-containing protein n=1 Tax=Sorghum bicolor TaxID=4558 RepID=A0A1W0VR17_SORBI|nr:uncharacterized protein LOC8067917 isoform X1 [Sorghum bicolor]OQU75714.1 hypothetical protein SORBI_3010G009600 [Sorghum bicolor]|eukprot:XP_021304545.1 uncharacterized protein LOC8067917 isoform X1 [Sorghum bicolor]